jgi:hypothetical protein
MTAHHVAVAVVEQASLDSATAPQALVAKAFILFLLG